MIFSSLEWVELLWTLFL